MRTDSYWSGRLDDLNEAQLAKGEKYVQSINDEYGKAMSSLQRDIDVFYQRFANNNGIVDMAEARQVLKAGELKEFKWTVDDYIKAGRENAIDQRWMRELENASIRVRVSRLEALQTQMQQHIELLSARKEKGASKVLSDIYRDNYHHSIFEVQKGLGVGSSFAQLDARQIDKMVSTPWAPDGANFSSRIWKDKTKLISELRTTLAQGLIRGDSSDRIIAEFTKRMGVSRSDAARLIMTESAFIAGQSRLDAYKELGVQFYKYTATLDKRTSSVCRNMDGQIYPINEAQAGVNYPPLHAHCRSTTIPHFEDNVKTRTARDKNGDSYDVPGDITYKEWSGEHVSDEPRTPLKSGEQGASGPTMPNKEPVTVDPPPAKVIDQVDMSDAELLDKKIKEYEDSIREETNENAYVFTPDGEVIHASGKATEVDIGQIGPAKLPESIVTHNHPDHAGLPGGSFSKEDIVAFIQYGLQELRAVDSKHNYRVSRKSYEQINISVDELILLLQMAEVNSKKKLTIEQLLAGYDIKHLTMVELAALLDWIVYERVDA